MSKFKKNNDELREHKMNVFSWIMFGFMAVYAILLLIPFVFAFVSSFKPIADFIDNMFGWTMPSLENYLKVFTEFKYQVILKDGSAGYFDFWGLTWNSLVLAIGCVFCETMTACIVAYCSAKFDFWISKILVVLVYALMAIPIIGTTGASIQMMRNIGLYDTMIGALFLKCNFLGMDFLLYYGNFKTIPSDFTEAARMDGAGNFRIFFKIMFPMVRNLFTLQMILGFVTYWSDYNIPLYYLPSVPTLSLAMLNFNELSFTSVTMQLAGCVLLSLPCLVMFILFKDKFMGNMQMGGVKG